MTNELVKIGGRVPQTSEEAFALMDQMDDEQILAQIENRVTGDIVQKLYYSFRVGGKAVEGLSKEGVDQCCRELATKNEFVREKTLTCVVDPTDPDYMLFSVEAVRIKVVGSREIMQDSVIGVKRQWLYMERNTRDGKEIIPDKFWYEKGAMKAARNAKSRLLPTILKSRLLQTLKTGKSSVRLEPQRTKQIQQEERKALPQAKPYTQEQKDKVNDLARTLGLSQDYLKGMGEEIQNPFAWTYDNANLLIGRLEELAMQQQPTKSVYPPVLGEDKSWLDWEYPFSLPGELYGMTWKELALDVTRVWISESGKEFTGGGRQFLHIVESSEDTELVTCVKAVLAEIKSPNEEKPKKHKSKKKKEDSE